MGIAALRFYKCIFSFLVLFFAKTGYAWNIGVEADLFHPFLRSIERTQFDRTWISPRVFLMDNFHVGADMIHDDGEVSGSASGAAIGERTAPSHYRGLSFGYYPSGYMSNSLRLSLGAGSAQRKFSDSLLGSTKDFGSFYLGEAGYQIVANLGLLGISLVWLNSNLKEQASFSSGLNQSNLEKGNSDVLMKVAVGIIF